MITADAEASVDEEADGAVVTSVATENATSVTVDNDHFEVADGNLKLKAGSKLDFESDSSPISVKITASGDGASAEHTVSVTINDVAEDPAFGADSYAFDLNENEDGSSTAVSVGTVAATDPDTDDAITYSITAGNDDGLFAIDADSGAITYVGSGENYRSADAGAARFTLTVQASSASDADADATATVAITVLNVNEAPVFATDSYAFDLAENQDGSDTAVDVGTVSATDTDEGDTVTYSIMEGGDSSLFAIDADSGAITYVGSGEDLETQATRTITVHASDGSLESAATVTVNITGANDNSPAWTFDEGKTFYEFMLHENADGSETAVAVGTVAATDADGDAVSYSISAGNDDGRSRSTRTAAPSPTWAWARTTSPR